MESFGFENVIGVELLEDYVDYARSKGRNVLEGDIHNLPFESEKFDIVYCRHTIEHSLNPDFAIKELYRVLRNGGVMYVSFPLEINVHGKHTVAIPNIKLFKKLIMKLAPFPEVLYIGRSDKVGIIEDGVEACALLMKSQG